MGARLQKNEPVSCFHVSQAGIALINLCNTRLHLATEYQGGAAKTTDTQRYWNVTVTLKDPEPAVGGAGRFTAYPKNIINITKPYSKDDKTWKIDEVIFLPHDTSAAATPNVEGKSED
jgi:hypothetical protein